MESRDAGDGDADRSQDRLMIAVVLRDGRTASVARDALWVGDESLALERLQDVRQIVPEPPTIAVRVAGRGLVEFGPVEPEQARLALEAIYRLRPDLRPVGFEAPDDVPRWWPAATEMKATPAWERAPSAFDRAEPSRGGQFTGGYPQFYARRPAGTPLTSPDGRLTPYPRDVMSLVGATFRLYLAHWRKWLVLGALAAGLPALATGALQMALYAVQGHNPFRAIDTSVVSILPAHLPKAGVLLALVALGFLLLIVFLLASAWQVTVLSSAARSALVGEPVDVRASLAAGTRRFVPVLLVTVAFAAAVLVAVGAPVGLLLLVTLQVGPSPSATTATLSAALSACFGLVWLAVGLALLVYAAGRLLLAPYLAATQPIDARAAIQASWQLTKGYWWHVVLPVVGVGLFVTLVSAPVGNVELLSYALEMLFAQPLANAVLSPLLVIAAMAVLEDLRLRNQGYEAVLHTPFT